MCHFSLPKKSLYINKIKSYFIYYDIKFTENKSYKKKKRQTRNIAFHTFPYIEVSLQECFQDKW